MTQWWQSAVFYQVYPRSFADGNGDGIGDLAGLLGKLDYLQSLGVDAVWLSPHYPSPLVDCGYDISDYCAVAPEYGTLEDFRALLADMHARGMRLVLDLVLNHTSDQHAWFQESRASKTSPKRDWFIWKPGKNDGPPNDWFSTFGGSAWELDPATGEYYYHFFFKEQPDLNWRNPQVKQAMFEMVRFWLDLGVDGFRLDAIGTVYEDPAWPDHQLDFGLDDLFLDNRKAVSAVERQRVAQRWDELFSGQHDLPEIHDLMRELRALVDGYPGRVLIGETDDIAFYGNGQDELHLVFNVPLMRTARITAAHVLANQQTRLADLPAGAWPCNTLGNHDSARMLNQFGDGSHDREIARLNLFLLLCLQGTPVLYNGEEIGMRDFLINNPADFRDPLSLRNMQLEMALLGTEPAQAVLVGALNGRDKCRTPMQWANQPNAGFCPPNVRPWLPVNPDFSVGVNAADQAADPASLLADYRRLLAFRRFQPVLQSGVAGEFGSQDSIFWLVRSLGGENLTAAANLSADPARLAVGGEILFSTHRRAPAIYDTIDLLPFEGIVLRR